jgi:hypothetical protein
MFTFAGFHHRTSGGRSSILTRDGAIGHFSTVTVSNGGADHIHSPRRAVLHHAVTISKQRLANRVAGLSSERMQEVCAALRFSLGCGWAAIAPGHLGNVWELSGRQSPHLPPAPSEGSADAF